MLIYNEIKHALVYNTISKPNETAVKARNCLLEILPSLIGNKALFRYFENSEITHSSENKVSNISAFGAKLTILTKSIPDIKLVTPTNKFIKVFANVEIIPIDSGKLISEILCNLSRNVEIPYKSDAIILAKFPIIKHIPLTESYYSPDQVNNLLMMKKYT